MWPSLNCVATMHTIDFYDAHRLKSQGMRCFSKNSEMGSSNVFEKFQGVSPIFGFYCFLKIFLGGGEGCVKPPHPTLLSLCAYMAATHYLATNIFSRKLNQLKLRLQISLLKMQNAKKL